MDIFNEAKKILANNLSVKEDDVKLESNLADDLGADSLDSVDLIMALEEKFNIEITDEEAQAVKIVKDIVSIIENKLQK